MEGLAVGPHLLAELSAIVPQLRRRIRSTRNASRDEIAAVLILTAIDLCDDRQRPWDLYALGCFQGGRRNRASACASPGHWITTRLLDVALRNLRSGALGWDDLAVAFRYYLGRGGQMLRQRWAQEIGDPQEVLDVYRRTHPRADIVQRAR